MGDQPAPDACAACGARNPVAARFCAACGARLSQDSGERRQLTVIFCDLVGSTALSDRLDPEDYSALMQSYHDRADEIVSRYGGSVGQYLGDGILAYFGWPTAYGDEPDRAVRAALALVEAVRGMVAEGRPLAARVGIHTGPVVVSEVDRGGRMDTVTLGDTLNVASRVQSLAEPDTVLITAATHRLVSGFFHVDDRGTHALKGVREPVGLYRVVRPSGVRNRLAAAAAKGLTPFVGRQSERGLLRGRWELAQQAQGQMVLISGEAGIGKSRLVAQLKEDLRAAPHTWIECGGSPHHQNSAFYPVTDLLQQLLDWRGDLPLEEKIGTIERAVTQVGLSPAAAVPLLAPLLDLPVPDRYAPLQISPEQQRQQLIGTLVAWMSASARLQPSVFVVEDLHWIDPSTLEFLTLLSERAATVPLLLVFTTRPGFQSPWRPRANHDHVVLRQLTREEVGEMVGHLTADAVKSSQVFEALVTRTGGVPLFVEELVCMLVETGLTATGIPETLQDSLMARLDRLGVAKQVAQVASVIGRRFSYELLRGIAQRSDAELQGALEILADAELIYAEGIVPDATYLFKHVLIQEAAYRSLLRRRRADLHRAVADCLVTRFQTLAEAQPEVVAAHYTSADAVSEALRWWQASGERASKRAAHAEAIEHYRTALELLATQPAHATRDGAELGLRVLLGLSLASSRGYAAPEVEQNYREAHEICQRLGETAELFPVVRGLCTFYIVRDSHLVAKQLAEQCLRIGQETQASEYLIEGYNALGYATFYLGEFRRSRALLERGVALYESHRGSPPSITPQDSGVAMLALLAPTLWLLGHPEQAVQRLQDALALARRLESPFTLAYCYTYAATACELWQDAARAAEYARAAIDLSAAHGFDVLRCGGMLHLGVAKARLGEADEGTALLTEALAAWRASGTEFMRGYFLAGLAEAHRGAGRLEEALESVNEALEHAARGPDRFYDAELHRLRAELLLARGPGSAEAAEADLWRALDIAREQQARSLELRTAVSLGRLLGAHRRHAEARALVRDVYGGFTEGLQTPDLREAAALLADLS